MRSLIGYLLVLLMVVFCAACSLSETEETAATPRAPTTAARPTDAQGEPLPTDLDGKLLRTTATTPQKLTYTYTNGQWDENLMPSEFPAAVEVNQEISTLHDTRSLLLGGDACEAWILSLRVTAGEWNALVEAFAGAGWNGGGVNPLRSADVELDGAWCGRDHYCFVYSCEYDAGVRLYTLQLATVNISTGDSVFPDELSAFPAFTSGYCYTGGVRSETENGGVRWSFGGAGRYVAVSQEEWLSYRQTLIDSGFTVTDRSDVDSEAICEEEDETRRVDLCYDSACCTLELVYTVMPAAS